MTLDPSLGFVNRKSAGIDSLDHPAQSDRPPHGIGFDPDSTVYSDGGLERELGRESRQERVL